MLDFVRPFHNFTFTTEYNLQTAILFNTFCLRICSHSGLSLTGDNINREKRGGAAKVCGNGIEG